MKRKSTSYRDGFAFAAWASASPLISWMREVQIRTIRGPAGQFVSKSLTISFTSSIKVFSLAFPSSPQLRSGVFSAPNSIVRVVPNEALFMQRRSGMEERGPTASKSANNRLTKACESCCCLVSSLFVSSPCELARRGYKHCFSRSLNDNPKSSEIRCARIHNRHSLVFPGEHRSRKERRTD